ncbi:hypothetical protein Tco_0302947 [Tanacetum coccineum]
MVTGYRIIRLNQLPPERYEMSSILSFGGSWCVVFSLSHSVAVGALALALMNWRHYIYGIRCAVTRASELYKLELPRELNEIQLDNKLHFIEDPVKFIDPEHKQLTHSRIPIVKVHWNSRRGPECTWEREGQIRSKYPHLFATTSPADVTR